MNPEVVETFGHTVRVRVCGLCIRDEKIVLVKHVGIGPLGEWWGPPGGGIQFGETAAQALQREFREETGLEIKVEKFLCINEFVNPPLHAIELFFAVEMVGGTLTTGYDPELTTQLIQEAGFKSWEDIQQLGKLKTHSLFHSINSLAEIGSMQGYYVS